MMNIQMTGTVQLLGTWPLLTFHKGQIYKAVHAENQPNWQERGAVFVENCKGESMLIEKGEYTLVSAPFVVGQRVRILPCGSWPAVKRMRYGIIHGATQHPGMCLVNENGRQSEAGEWAFIVASYASPNAGAMWFSAKGLEPMKRVPKNS